MKRPWQEGRHDDMNKNLSAIGFILSGMCILGAIDNVIVLISPEVGLWQFHFARSALAVPMLLAVGLAFGWRLRPNRLWWVTGRNMFLSIAMFIYFGCLGFFPIAQVAAGLFTAPIFVMIISAVWTRQPIGPIRIFAALVGFVGTMLVLRPEVGAFGWPNLIPIAAGLSYAFGNVVTRRWCEGESAFALLWSYMAIMGVMGGAVLVYLMINPTGLDGYLTRGWVWPSGTVWFWIVMQAIFSLIGIGFIMQAYLIGEVTYVTIFEYAMLISAGLTAYLAFGQVVPPLGLLGIAIIVATGVVIVMRTAKADAP